MSRVLDILFWVVGLGAIGFAIWQFINFVQSEGEDGNTTFLWYAIGAAVIGCVSILAYFLRHVNKEEEIHITSQ